MNTTEFQPSRPFPGSRTTPISPVRILSKLLLITMALLALAEPASAQLYPNRTRNASIEWEELRSETFRILYPRQAHAAAVRTANLLDWQYPLLSESIGGTLRDFPIVLNPANSLSNGYVTTLVTRSEIELRPIKGKTLNPRSGGWLETVVPHELVHAVHFGVRPRWSPTNLLDLISPDLTRSIHSAVPLGFHEGIAVDHESEGVHPGAGRANYAYFTGRFTAVDEVRPWSMGQLFHTSTATLPYDRHYLGGTAFMQWFRTRYGQEAVRELIRRHYNAPFLGFGVALLGTTGHWPSELHRQFKADLPSPTPSHSNSATPPPELLLSGRGWTGARMGRPIWRSNERILVHAVTYNAPSGFYEVTLDTSVSTPDTLHVPHTPLTPPMRLLHEARSVGDLVFTFDPDSTHLWYAAYTPNRRYDEVWTTRLRGFPLVDSDDLGDSEGLEGFTGNSPSAPRPGSPPVTTSDGILTLPSGASLFAPSWNARHAIALLDTLDTPAIVAIRPVVENPDRAALDTLLMDPGLVPVQVALHPGASDSLAVLARKNRVQGIWLLDHPSSIAASLTSRPPDVAVQDGSILDITWHPGGGAIAFTADSAGTLSIFELNLPRRTVRPLVHTRHNAFEPAYSPDGTRLAYIRQHVEEQLLAIIPIPPAPPTPQAPQAPAAPPIQPIPAASPAQADHSAPFSAGLPHPASSPSPPAIPTSNPSPAAPPAPDAPLPPHWERSPRGQSVRWLRPRLVLPYAASVAGRDEQEVGVQLASSDILRENTYNANLTLLENRLWSDIRYRHSGFWPGFGLAFKSRPSYLAFRLPSGDGGTYVKELLMREQTLGLSVPFEWNLSPGLHRGSRLRIEPSAELGQATLHLPGDAGPAVSDGFPVQRIGLFASWSRQLRQFDRDVMPNAGQVVYLQTDRDAQTSPFEFEVDGRRYRGSFAARYGVRAGVSTYFPLISRLNQSGRLRLEWIRQSTNPYYSLQSLTRGLVSTHPVQGSGQGIYADARLTFPLTHPDQGWLTVPLYLGNVYGVAFTRAFLPMEATGISPVPGRASAGVGIGLRTRFRLSNLMFDAGVGVFFNLSEGSAQLEIGEF